MLVFFWPDATDGFSRLTPLLTHLNHMQPDVLDFSTFFLFFETCLAVLKIVEE